MGVRISQEVVEVLKTPIPRIRVSQEVAEVLLFKIPNARLSQEAVEVATTPHIFSKSVASVIAVTDTITFRNAVVRLDVSSNISVSQGITYGPKARLSQEVVEVLETPIPNIRLSQEIAEVLLFKTPNVRFSQEVVEVAIGPYVDTQSIVSDIGVTQTISTSIISTINRQSITSNIIVADTITFRNTVVRLDVSSNIVVSQGIAYSSKARLSQEVVEVLKIPIPNIRVSQEITEVLVHKVPNAYVSQEVVEVATTPHINTQSITSNIVVTPTIVARNPTVILNVSSNISVSQEIIYGPKVRLSQEVVEVLETPIPRIRISQEVAEVLLYKIPKARLSQEVVEVAIGPSTYVPVINSQSVTSNIAVTPTIAYRNTVVRISVVSNLNAAQTSSGRSDIVHEGIETDINVSSIIIARNTNVPVDVLSTLTLTPIIFARSTIIHMSVFNTIFVSPIITVFNPNIAIESDVHITQVISTRNTVLRLSLQSNIIVTPTVRHSPNEQEVQSDISVDGSTFNTAIKFYINPVRYSFIQPIYLDQIVAGGASHRNIAVQNDITVTPTIRNGFVYQSVTNVIEVTTNIAGGSSTRSFSLQDNIVVTPTVAVRDTIIRKSLIDHINVNHEIINTTHEVPLSVQSNIIVNPTLATRIVKQYNILHAIEVHQNILARPDNNHQSVIDTITITPNIRSSPNYQTVISAINVSSRVQQPHQFIISAIHVDQQINLTRTRLIIQQVPITQTLVANRIVNRTIRSDIAVTQAIKANHDYIRTIIQHLPVYDTFYPLDLSFSDNPVLIPVAIGTIVSATLMVIRGQHGAIQLPPAQLNDSVEGIGKMNVRKSMDGTAYSYVQRIDRQKLTYRWLLSHLKVYELRTFIGNNISDLLTMENWKGETWIVRIVSNPFEFSNQGVWEKDKEFAEVEIQFEGKKVGG